MPITRQTPQLDDDSQRLLCKLVNNLNGVISGAFGFLVRGTVEISPSTSTTGHTPSFGELTITTGGTAQRITNVQTLVNSVILTPGRSATGRFFYGSTSTAGKQTVQLPLTLVAPDGKKIDLSLIWIDATDSGQSIAYETIT